MTTRAEKLEQDKALDACLDHIVNSDRDRPACRLMRALTPDMPAEDIDWLADLIEAFWRDHRDEFEFVDNVRLGIEGDPTTEGVYHDQASGGCCGSWDTRLGPSPSGRTYLYGFNHGH